MNSIIQGSASDLIKYAMKATHQEFLHISSNMNAIPLLLMQIHDELIFQVPIVENLDSPLHINNVVNKLCHVMEEKVARRFELRVPLKVNVSIGDNWGALKPINHPV